MATFPVEHSPAIIAGVRGYLNKRFPFAFVNERAISFNLYSENIVTCKWKEYSFNLILSSNGEIVTDFDFISYNLILRIAQEAKRYLHPFALSSGLETFELLDIVPKILSWPNLSQKEGPLINGFELWFKVFKINIKCRSSENGDLIRVCKVHANAIFIGEPSNLYRDKAYHHLLNLIRSQQLEPVDESLIKLNGCIPIVDDNVRSLKFTYHYRNLTYVIDVELRTGKVSSEYPIYMLSKKQLQSLCKELKIREPFLFIEESKQTFLQDPLGYYHNYISVRLQNGTEHQFKL
jgi:hypothetical protein